MYWTATIKKIRTFLDKKKPKQTKLKKTSNMPEEKKTNLRTSEGAFRNTPLNQKNQLAKSCKRARKLVTGLRLRTSRFNISLMHHVSHIVKKEKLSNENQRIWKKRGEEGGPLGVGGGGMRVGNGLSWISIITPVNLCAFRRFERLHI